MDPRADDYVDLAAEIAKARPDAIYFGGAETSNALRLWRDLDDALPEALLIGSQNLLVPSFYERLGSAERRTYITSVAQDTSQLPPAGRRFVRDYTREFGERPDPLAAYGYAAMSLVLDALDRAGDRAAERERVVEELLETTNFNSVVGRFSIDDNGDTSLERIAGLPRAQRAAGVRGAAARAQRRIRSKARRRPRRATPAGAVVSSTEPEREMPARRASSATACATASATRRSNTLGMM